MKINRTLQLILVSAFLIVGALVASSYTPIKAENNNAGPIKVGVLHSLTGTMALSEKPVADATLLAIEEINNSGGILGRTIEPILIDGESDERIFAKKAKKLVKDEKVDAVFGGWTSASRKRMLKVFERYDNLLFYPLQYEGLEDSKNIVYLGSTPNQQSFPAIKWFMENRGRRFFLVGSDYVYPRTVNEILKDYIKYLGGKVVGEKYIPLGSQDLNHVIADIKDELPDVIVNTINGDSNITFFKELRNNGIYPHRIPTLSFSLTENEVYAMDINNIMGDYASWSYFNSIDTSVNNDFSALYTDKYGDDLFTSDPIEAAYVGVYIWRNAVLSAGTTEPSVVKKFVGGQSYDGPGGTIYIDEINNHAWKNAHLAEIMPDGQFKIVWSSESLIRPVPRPVFRTREAWDTFLSDMYMRWGASWAKPSESE